MIVTKACQNHKNNAGNDVADTIAVGSAGYGNDAVNQAATGKDGKAADPESSAPKVDDRVGFL